VITSPRLKSRVPLVVRTVTFARREDPVLFGCAVNVTVVVVNWPKRPPVTTRGVTQSGIPDTVHVVFDDTVNENVPPPAGNPGVERFTLTFR